MKHNIEEIIQAALNELNRNQLIIVNNNKTEQEIELSYKEVDGTISTYKHVVTFKRILNEESDSFNWEYVKHSTRKLIYKF